MLIVNEKISASGSSRVTNSAEWDVTNVSVQEASDTYRLATEGMSASLLEVLQVHPFAQSRHSICMVERFHDNSILCTLFATDGTRLLDGVRILGNIVACAATIETPLITKYFLRRYGDNEIVYDVKRWQMRNKL
jgi:hypothetical protein